ncbi:MAG: alpha/beta fold hydrolase [Sporolactobacillus sp.]
MNQMIETANGQMSGYFRKANGQAPTLVFLEGFGGTNAFYNFKAVIDRLPRAYGILTLDYLGYGLSEITDAPRTIENIRNELHTAIQGFHLSQILLFAHSIGGFLGFDYYLHHPATITGFIAIEPTTYEVLEAHPEENANFLKEAELFNRLSAEQKEKELMDVDREGQQNPYLSKKEAQIDWEIAISKAFNKNLIDGTRRSMAILKTIRGKQITDELPTLIFSTPQRAKEFSQSNYLSQNKFSKLVSLEGNHYLHWGQPDPIVHETNAFIDKLQQG